MLLFHDVSFEKLGHSLGFKISCFNSKFTKISSLVRKQGVVH
jgi:hypothetical protein